VPTGFEALLFKVGENWANLIHFTRFAIVASGVLVLQLKFRSVFEP
jgi:hypothetical protein